MSEFETSQDDFLGGRTSLTQPKKGYRITSDTVFLAASLDVKPGQKILDMGAGSGGILSCLEARMGDQAKTISMTGIEYQPELITLARLNSKYAEYHQGDIMGDVEGCEPNSYHHVVSNPPYYEKGKVSASPYRSKSLAHGNEMETLELWIERCLRMLRPKGFFTLVHRADRLDDIITALKPKSGAIIIYPLWPNDQKEANRVIIRAQKGTNGLLSLKSGLIVHKSDGNYTDAAENILRHADSLNIEK